jgi:hypothetical protein
MDSPLSNTTTTVMLMTASDQWTERNWMVPESSWNTPSQRAADQEEDLTVAAAAVAAAEIDILVAPQELLDPALHQEEAITASELRISLEIPAGKI